jgi:hypothetical protein
MSIIDFASKKLPLFENSDIINKFLGKDSFLNRRKKSMDMWDRQSTDQVKVKSNQKHFDEIREYVKNEIVSS